jgi:hypothetical protein
MRSITAATLLGPTNIQMPVTGTMRANPEWLLIGVHQPYVAPLVGGNGPNLGRAVNGCLRLLYRNTGKAH